MIRYTIINNSKGVEIGVYFYLDVAAYTLKYAGLNQKIQIIWMNPQT